MEKSQNRPDFYRLISRSFLIMFFYQARCLSGPFSTPSSVIFSTELNWYKDDGLILISLSFLPQLFVSIALLVLSPGISAYVPILQHAGGIISESFVLLHVVSAGKLLFSRLTRFHGLYSLIDQSSQTASARIIASSWWNTVSHIF